MDSQIKLCIANGNNATNTDKASVTNQACPSFIAPVNDRVATALRKAAMAQGKPPQPF